MGGRLFDWLGSGVAADRPAAADMPALLVSPGSTAIYFATDTKIIGFFDESGPTWFDVDVASLAAIAFATLSDVDWSTPPTDGQLFAWDDSAGKLVPVTITIPSVPTSNDILDLIGAMFTDGSGIVTNYDSGTHTLLISCSLFQYTDEMAQDALAAAFVAGSHTNLTISYDDATNKYDFAVTGITSYSAETAQDDVLGAIVASDGIDVNYDDGANQFTIKTVGATVHAEQDADFTPDLTMANRWIPCDTSAGDIEVTLPDDATVAFPVNTTLIFDHLGGGALSFVGGQSRGSLTDSAGEFAVIQAKKIAADTWRLLGDLA